MVCKWYILPIGGLYATYHLLREPGNYIETMVIKNALVRPAISLGVKGGSQEVFFCPLDPRSTGLQTTRCGDGLLPRMPRGM